VQTIVSCIEALTEANGSDNLSIQALGITTISPCNATCKPCGEKGHYSAKWSRCTQHEKQPINDRVGATAVKPYDLRQLLPSFDSNLSESDDTEQVALSVIRPQRIGKRNRSTPLSK
jgi:hypothetical protein